MEIPLFSVLVVLPLQNHFPNQMNKGLTLFRRIIIVTQGCRPPADPIKTVGYLYLAVIKVFSMEYGLYLYDPMAPALDTYPDGVQAKKNKGDSEQDVDVGSRPSPLVGARRALVLLDMLSSRRGDLHTLAMEPCLT
ncbi:hypothetical protein AKJ16_DCAP10174 [Drosera capensis]